MWGRGLVPDLKKTAVFAQTGRWGETVAAGGKSQETLPCSPLAQAWGRRLRLSSPVSEMG